MLAMVLTRPHVLLEAVDVPAPQPGPGQACAHGENHQDLRHQRFHKPPDTKNGLVGLKHQQQHGKDRYVEHGTDWADPDHEALDQADIPVDRPLDYLDIDIVQRQSDLGGVVDQVGQQHLDWQQRQEWQDQPGQHHAEYVAEIGAAGDQDVFAGVDDGAPPSITLSCTTPRSCSSRMIYAAA